MRNFNRRLILQGSVAAAASGFLGESYSATLPDLARIIVGFPPGGTPDLIARRLAEQLNGKLAKSVVVDNKPGAAGRIAADIARQYPADGLTLLINPSGMLTIYPFVYKNLNYKPFTDFAPISKAANVDFVFVVGPSVPAEVKTLANFAAWTKANPSRAAYGSPSAGSPPHFFAETVNRTLGLGMTHVPYRGGPPAVVDVLGGQIPSIVINIGEVHQYLRSGKLRALATTGAIRSRYLPDVPTFSELQVRGLEHRDWFAVYIAGRPSADVVTRVGPLVRSALSSKEYVLALNESCVEASHSTAEELDRLAREDQRRWEPLVKASGFEADS